MCVLLCAKLYVFIVEEEEIKWITTNLNKLKIDASIVADGYNETNWMVCAFAQGITQSGHFGFRISTVKKNRGNRQPSIPYESNQRADIIDNPLPRQHNSVECCCSLYCSSKNLNNKKRSIYWVWIIHRFIHVPSLYWRNLSKCEIHSIASYDHCWTVCCRHHHVMRDFSLFVFSSDSSMRSLQKRKLSWTERGQKKKTNGVLNGLWMCSSLTIREPSCI